MVSDWTNNEPATRQVKNLLEQAGVPLELQAAGICTKFSDTNDRPRELAVMSEKLVYMPSTAVHEYREVDQLVSIYEEFELGKLTGIQLQLKMPIECKYRSDVECFAFQVAEGNVHFGFPVVSSFTGSQLWRNIRTSYKSLENLSVSNITLMEIEAGRTPRRVHKENLIYNAAGSLYDFIIFDESLEYPTADAPEVERLFTEFQNHLGEKYYAWWSTLLRWIESIGAENVDSFNARYFGNSRIYHLVSAHMPIVCVNGPIYGVKWNASSGIQSFAEIPYCVTSIRKRGWPGGTRFKLATFSSEAPVILTNISGLESVLDLGLTWFNSIRESLSESDSEAETRWALESAFVDKCVKQYGHKKQSPAIDQT
jgi:hypothetical protein